MYELTEELTFPHPNLADESGILAWGGDLSVERLKLAYSYGIFPWYNEDEPIIWWSPKRRFVLFPSELKISKSMKKVLRDNTFDITMNRDFETVLKYCKNIPRFGQDGTWITDEMEQAYLKLHKEGIAQSIEVWSGKKLVGGLYGLSIGNVFCGESMFTLVSNASKAGFITFVQYTDYEIIDCQIHTTHLESLGARYITRSKFLEYLGVK